MNDISVYFRPVNTFELPVAPNPLYKRMGEVIDIYSAEGSFPDLRNIDIALIGVDEDRRAIANEGCSMAADFVREYLYRLYPGDYPLRIADLGTLIRGHEVTDTYFALSTVVSELVSKKIVPVIIGGGQDLTYAIYKAYENLKHIINIAAVDNLFDLGEGEKEVNSRSYLSHIILHKPNFLFNFTNIGYQTYFVDQGAITLMKNLFFDINRLGMARANLPEIEPLVRNCDVLSFDISAIRQTDAPGNGNATPNGFYGEEACQIMRYAGLSEKLSSVGIFEVNPAIDRHGQTAHLVAQMIWYFIDGFYHRQDDFPNAESDDFIRYTVQLTNHDEGIIFYKSKKTDRWWMEVKCTEDIRYKYMRHYIVPCTYGDYQTACSDELPDRWWQAYQKLM